MVSNRPGSVRATEQHYYYRVGHLVLVFAGAAAFQRQVSGQPELVPLRGLADVLEQLGPGARPVGAAVVQKFTAKLEQGLRGLDRRRKNAKLNLKTKKKKNRDRERDAMANVVGKPTWTAANSDNAQQNTTDGRCMVGAGLCWIE